MKPDQNMHAAAEEVDPCELYTELGTLIVEGRVPGTNDKGFSEGPHCATPHGQARHQCDNTSPECQKYEQILKHMLLLWRNGIPMTIEVLLYPGCCAPLPSVDSVHDMPYILLEQWTIHMLPRRVPDATISPRGLIQAVRSFLYFSQLCAWYSLTGGKSPENVHYRVCVPGEAFSSKFSSPADCHVFPVANIGKNHAMKVLMKCHPRCGQIPQVPCQKHSEPNLPLKTLKGKERHDPAAEYVYDGIVPRTSSPALGESLLDPPNSLCMYPKRYQSPSRCGSPSIEVPEHLMFGKKKPEPKSPPRRSRPQRRPVVERFLKKNLGDPLPSEQRSYDLPKDKQQPILKFLKKNLGDPLPTEQSYELQKDKQQPILKLGHKCIDDCLKHVPKEEMDQVLGKLRESRKMFVVPKAEEDPKAYSCMEECLHVPKEEMDHVLKGLRDRHLPCMEECMKHVPKEEMDHVLKGLRDRHLRSKFVTEKDEVQSKDQSLDDLFGKMKIAGEERLLGREPSTTAKTPSPKTPLWLQELAAKSTDNKPVKCDIKPTRPSDKYPSVHSSKEDSKYSLKEYLQRTDNGKRPHRVGSAIEERGPTKDETYQISSSSSSSSSLQPSLHPLNCSVNIKKCGGFLPKSDELTDERELPAASENNNQTGTPDELLEDEVSPVFPCIPSAEKKAIFRRSLDSATSLVFHQRSGLPLTSSPAPIRKCGTCFDYDSSLTSVSAIKRALFEKDDTEEEAEDPDASFPLSASAPASIFSSSLLGTFEESVLNGRLEPVSTVEGFTAEIGASGSFCPRHIRLPVTVFFYTLHDMDKVTSPYMGHIDLRSKDYHIPKKGTVQVTLFNPHATVVKMFVVRYDLSDMPVNCQTFLRQRTLYMPAEATAQGPDAHKWLRYLIHLRFVSSKSGRIYLHTDIRMIVFRKSDLDAAHGREQRPYEMRTFAHSPLNPKFSPHKP